MKYLKRAFICSIIFMSMSAAETAAKICDFKSIKNQFGSILAGSVTTIAIHELGHFAAAELDSTHAEFDGATIVYSDKDLNDRQNLRLSSAGYQSQWLASEYAFSKLKNTGLTARSKAFNTGMVLGHIGISLAYLTALKSHQNGDSLGVATASSWSEDQVLLMLAIPAVLDSWRLFGKHPPKWLPVISKGSKAVSIAAIWSF